MTAYDRWLNQMTIAAYDLGTEGRLYDPSDDDVLIYAAEMIRWDLLDLSKLAPEARRQIIDAYDRGTGL